MNCLHIISGDLWAGAEVSVWQLATELARRPGFNVGAVVLNPGTLEAKLRLGGVRTWVIEEHGSSISALLTRARKATAEFDPDVIHTHRYKENLIGAVLSITQSVVHIRTAHGLSPSLGWDGGPIGIGALLDAALADWTSSTWIAVSEELAGRIDGLRRSIHVVRNGIPPAGSSLDSAQLHDAVGPDAEDSWLIGFVGRLEEVKRPDRFLRVFASLPDEVAGRRVHGVVVGDGSMAARLRGLAAKLGIRGRISFLGHRDGADALVAALDVLVISSDHEGLPMVLLEAMRSGVAVAANKVGGIPEAIGSSPWVVPPEDEAGLARAVTGLLNDPDARRAWSSELVDRFRRNFTISSTVDQTIEVYESLLHSRPGGSHGTHRTRG